MELIIYPRLSTRSKRAIIREKKRYGHRYAYVPRYQLIERLKSELGWSTAEVLAQIARERKWLLQYTQYFS